MFMPESDLETSTKFHLWSIMIGIDNLVPGSPTFGWKFVNLCEIWSVRVKNSWFGHFWHKLGTFGQFRYTLGTFGHLGW